MRTDDNTMNIHESCESFKLKMSFEIIFKYLRSIKDQNRLGTPTVDTPLGVAIFITYCNREAAINCSDQMNYFALLALEAKNVSFARICCLLTCGRKKT